MMGRLAGQIWSEPIVEKQAILSQNWLFHRDLNFSILHLCLSSNYLTTWTTWMDLQEPLCPSRFSVSGFSDPTKFGIPGIFLDFYPTLGQPVRDAQEGREDKVVKRE